MVKTQPANLQHTRMHFDQKVIREDDVCFFMGTVHMPSLNIQRRRLSGSLLEVELILKVDVSVWVGYDNHAASGSSQRIKDMEK